MKLPEYDNRPTPGTPLYGTGENPFTGLRIFLWAASALVLLFGSIAGLIYALFN
jgi:hypothetical protein